MLDLRFIGLRKGVAMLVICGSLAAPLMAGEAKTKPEPAPIKDPNERVCEKISVIGSRLATRRVCATRAEWDEKRRLDKEAVDLAQKSACTPQGGC
jgi:hypothetical protein